MPDCNEVRATKCLLVAPELGPQQTPLSAARPRTGGAALSLEPLLHRNELGGLVVRPGRYRLGGERATTSGVNPEAPPTVAVSEAALHDLVRAVV